MTFDPQKVGDFETLFNKVKPIIESFEGCGGVTLLQDVKNPNVFFTYSNWMSEDHLNKYRFSVFFKDTWSKTKALFIEKPEAWSLVEKKLPAK